MKCAKLYTLLFTIAIFETVPATAQFTTSQQHIQTANSINTTKKVSLDDPASASWYNKAVNNIKDLAVAFRPQSKRGCYGANGSKQHTAYYISPNSYTVSGIQKQANWEVAFNLKGIGRKQIQWKPNNDYSVTQHNNEIVYQYEDVQVQYINNDDGLRQNFVVEHKMPGEGAVTITIEPKSTLTAKLANNKLAFYSASNEQQLSYEDLKVWDANKQELPASMHVEGGLLTLTVDDAQAAYPITIDPINKTPEWATTASGLLNGLDSLKINSALYGYTVNNVGDVNGDGYGDVAISAPALADVFSGTGSLLSVGSVFVYYGSPTGFSTTPAKTLQPNTAVAGALFGFSIDAGDVNGDGYSDIIIGAPLDSYSTIASGLLGNSTVTVTAGKVYVYPGGTAVANNPSNFLTVKLDGTNFFTNGLLGILGNVTVNALYGFSVAATNDLNGDNKADIIVGAPAYLNIGSTVQTGAAFVLLSNSANDFSTSTPISLTVPPTNLLGLISLPILNTSALLYGFSVDGVGDFNNDGFPDVVVGAPAGVDLSSLGGLLTGQTLGGSAYVYYGNGNGVNPAIGARLQASTSGLLGSAANLFGFKVKGLRNSAGTRTGGIAIGAPLGGLLPNALGLAIQTGSVQVFKKRSVNTAASTNPVAADQVIESPRSSSVLQVLNTMNTNLLFGTSIDNAYDNNCDGSGDIIVGEPLSSATNLLGLQANAVGGAAHVFSGNGTGGFIAAPAYTIGTSLGNELLSVNAVSLFGYSVTSVPNAYGTGMGPRVVAGAPAGALDFSSGLLNLGSTLNTVLGFAAAGNGPGKSFQFNANTCSSVLPVTLVDFLGTEKNSNINLQWKVALEENMNYYELQRSNNGSDFESIAMVFPWEDKSRTDYNYLDKNVPYGSNYYRLKMVEKNGTYNYSRILTFSLGNVAGLSIAVMPNPVINNIRIQFDNVGNTTYKLEMRNAMGQLFMQKNVQVTQNRQTENLIRPASMTSGVYFLNLVEKGTNKVTSYKVIVL